MIKIKLNNKTIKVNENKTILDICNENKIKIPTLCYKKELFPEARCRICLVEMNNLLVTACSTKPLKNSIIITDSKRIMDARKRNLELMNSKIDLKKLSDKLSFEEIFEQMGLDEPIQKKNKKIKLGDSLIFNKEKCIKCGRCVQTCAEIQKIFAIDYSGRGYNEHITGYNEKSFSNIACIRCGQCLINCPTGAISEVSHLEEVKKALNNKKKMVIAQPAPAIRVTLGELFNMAPGTIVTGKMVSALKKCGFKKVFDVDFGADMVIMEESAELIQRINENKNLPMITSCCPSWILMAEFFYPELIKNLSTCKSPHEMSGILIKTYYAEKKRINPKNIVLVSVMPCVAKKFESQRPELKGVVDYVITTREFGQLIKEKNIDFKNLNDSKFDDYLGMSSGAGDIFGTSGGVMEAALRTAYETANNKKLKKVDFKNLRTNQYIKTGKIKIKNRIIRYACVSGGKNIRELLKEKQKYDFIEVMACPGGCINGGGQPRYFNEDVLKLRKKALYKEDSMKKIRRSHENPLVKEIYKNYLNKPLSKQAEKLLHTSYVQRK